MSLKFKLYYNNNNNNNIKNFTALYNIFIFIFNLFIIYLFIYLLSTFCVLSFHYYKVDKKKFKLIR